MRRAENSEFNRLPSSPVAGVVRSRSTTLLSGPSGQATGGGVDDVVEGPGTGVDGDVALGCGVCGAGRGADRDVVVAAGTGWAGAGWAGVGTAM
jgi:hypothetical protein